MANCNVVNWTPVVIIGIIAVVICFVTWIEQR